jgi:hypothetical protein
MGSLGTKRLQHYMSILVVDTASPAIIYLEERKSLRRKRRAKAKWRLCSRSTTTASRGGELMEIEDRAKSLR